MITLNNLIASKLPFLDMGNDAVLDRVNVTKAEVKIILQPYLKKLEEDDAQYSLGELVLIAAYTAYQLIKTKAISTVGGDVTANQGGGAKVLTKAKGDVNEAEFQVLKASDGANISLNTETLLQEFKKEICQQAASLRISLPMCDCNDEIVKPPFKVHKWR